MDNTQSIAGFLDTYDVESLTVSTAAVGFDTDKINDATVTSGGGKARAVFVTCETSRVRYWFHGSDPTSTIGHELFPGQSLQLIQLQQIKDIRFIRHSADSVDAVLRVSYQR